MRERPGTNRTYIDLDALRGERSHGRNLLGRVVEKLSPPLVPLDAVQAVPLQVVAALQYHVGAPLHGARHHHHHIPQWLHQSCNERGSERDRKDEEMAVMRLSGVFTKGTGTRE